MTEEEFKTAGASSVHAAGWVIVIALALSIVFLASVWVDGWETPFLLHWQKALILFPSFLWLVWFDVREYRLPNLITLPLILSGICLAAVEGRDALILSALGAMFGYGIILVLHKGYLAWRGRSGIGMGDAKLLAAGGAFLSFSAIGPILLFGSLFGVLIALFQNRKTGQSLFNGVAMVPFGPALVLSIWVCFAAQYYFSIRGI